MGCYECGSPEGNEARLCKTCNEKRNESQGDRVELLAPRVKEIPPAQLTLQQWVLAGVGSISIITALIWVLGTRPPTAQDPTASAGQKAYARCILKFSDKIAGEAAKGQLEAGEVSTVSTCTAMKEECDKEPTGDMCVLMLQGL